MIALLLLAAAPSAIDAERAFAADAQRRGQWTAFRATASENAVMFNPGPVNAQASLKDKKDPPQSVEWWPAQTFVSCDGNTAVNHGPWSIAARQAHGSFTTIWERRAEGWRWIYDGGDGVKTAKPKKPLVRKANCAGRPNRAMALPHPNTMPGQEVKERSGQSYDGTLAWSWTVDSRNTRRFATWLWTGRGFAKVLDQTVPAE